MNPSTLAELVNFSRERRIGVGMFNVANLEFAQAVYDAAQETGLPVMFGVPERFFNFFSVDGMSDLFRHLICGSRVPIAIHLDHCRSFDGTMRALRMGFSSVMFDGSALDYEENVARTAEIVKVAHPMGVSVEAELGYVGLAATEEVDDSKLTQPDQAADFVRRTGVDALAVAIGNQHGQYKGAPKLDFQRLKAISERVDCGLVLHGGSGIRDEDFVESIRCGINKVNIYTAMDLEAKRFTKERFDEFPGYLEYCKGLRSAVKEVVKRHMLLFAQAQTA